MVILRQLTSEEGGKPGDAEGGEHPRGAEVRKSKTVVFIYSKLSYSRDSQVGGARFRPATGIPRNKRQSREACLLVTGGVATDTCDDSRGLHRRRVCEIAFGRRGLT